LFKRHVQTVEVETFSYCNRVCSYCPNATYDRRSFTSFMPAEHLTKIARGLMEIDYDRSLVLSHYNEPLSHDAIVEQIALFRQIVPKASISIYSNGDYLTRSMFDRLAEAGLDDLFVSIHLGATEAYDDEKVLARVAKLSRELDIPADILRLERGKLIVAAFKTTALKKFVMFERNYNALGSNRGGSLPVLSYRAVREAPCFFPFHTFNVSYGGNISPCCQIRGDIPIYADTIIGNIGAFDSIFDAYGSAKAADWRRDLYAASPKSGPCQHCHEGIVPLDAAGNATRVAQLAAIAADPRRIVHADAV
jgi:hypothetical protein